MLVTSDECIKKLDEDRTKEKYKAIYVEAVILHLPKIKVPSQDKTKKQSQIPVPRPNSSQKDQVYVRKGYKYIKASDNLIWWGKTEIRFLEKIVPEGFLGKCYIRFIIR